MEQNLTYSALLLEIRSLAEKAAAALEGETRSAIDKICAQMREFGLTPDDLEHAKNAAPPARKVPAPRKSRAKKKTRGKYRPIYQDPATGVTWAGRGKEPKWMELAISQGKTREDFRIPR